MTTDIPYHLALLVFSAAALWVLHRRPRPVVLMAIAVWAAAVAWLAAGFLASGTFAFLRLLTRGLFVQAPILLAGAAWVFSRHRRRLLAGTLLAAAGMVALAGAWATWIEPRWLQVSRVEIRSAKIRQPIRVAVVADLQAEAFGDHERHALEATLAAEPDLVLLPGDYFQIDDPARRQEAARRFNDYLRSSGFGAPMGAFAVRGDVEAGGWTSLFDGTRVTAVDPASGSATTLQLPGLTLTALSRDASRSRSLALGDGDGSFHVVFGHAPDFALGEVAADLLIAGHVHGGQVRLPLIGPLLTFSAVPRGWAAGVTDLGGGRTLVVSRGVGMERGQAPRLRFLCRPEIVVIDLLPSTT